MVNEHDDYDDDWEENDVPWFDSLDPNESPYASTCCVCGKKYNGRGYSETRYPCFECEERLKGDACYINDIASIRKEGMTWEEKRYMPVMQRNSPHIVIVNET